MPIIASVATSRPSIAACSAAKPPTSEPKDLADPQEDRIQAHHGTAVIGIRLRHVGQQPQRGRSGPANTKSPAPATSAKGDRNRGSSAPLWLKARAPRTSTAPPTMP